MEWQNTRSVWPNAAASRFVASTPHRWHVQEAGTGPLLLLLHGAGGATQSWRHLFPLLAAGYHVVAPDLPGQGFTKLGTRQRCGLRPMAQDLWALCDQEGWAPDCIIGHSAGGALALEMALLRPEPPGPGHIIGLNPALSAFSGAAEWLFPALAKLLTLTPFVPELFARLSGTPQRVAEILKSTGSHIDPEGLALYHRLVSDPDHVRGTLAMMAQWRIGSLLARLPQIETKATFLVGMLDSTVPPKVSQDAAAKMPNARVVDVTGLGHLMHEERAEDIALQIDTILARDTGISAATQAGSLLQNDTSV